MQLGLFSSESLVELRFQKGTFGCLKLVQKKMGSYFLAKRSDVFTK